MMSGFKPKNRMFSSRGIYDYFYLFFTESRRPAKLVLIAFFSIFLIVPIQGGPSRASVSAFESGFVFLGLNVVFFLAGLTLWNFNRRLADPRLKGTGRLLLSAIFLSIAAYSISAIMILVLGNEVDSVLRAASSLVIVVPLVLVISLLVESVIRRGIVESGSRVPIGLVFVTIFLAMYTFATVYFVNGLLIRVESIASVTGGTNLGPVNFDDAFYFSGLVFTTLGSSDMFPVGAGKWVMVFESVTGYLMLGFLTAIFIQAIISAREGKGS
jgi:hypothetical protein